MHNENLIEKPKDTKGEWNDESLWGFIKHGWYYHLAFHVQVPIRRLAWRLENKMRKGYDKSRSKMDEIDGGS